MQCDFRHAAPWNLARIGSPIALPVPDDSDDEDEINIINQNLVYTFDSHAGEGVRVYLLGDHHILLASATS